MSTCVEAVAPAETIPDHVPAIEQGNFVFPVGREPRTSEPAEQWGLVGSSSPLVASVLANCGRLNLCLHSQAAGFADTYLTFAGADSRDPDFETMLRWLRAKISCWRGSSVSIGIGGSKVVAAIASRVAPSGGECVVAPGTEEAFLAPVSVQKLRGVVQIEARALAERGISTVGQLRQIPKPLLINVFGDASGRALWDAARWRDAKKVGRWKLGSLFSLSQRSTRRSANRQPGWIQRLCLLMRTRLEALDRVLERILTIPDEEVPPQTTPRS